MNPKDSTDFDITDEEIQEILEEVERELQEENNPEELQALLEEFLN